jgi:hypothetical protein
MQRLRSLRVAVLHVSVFRTYRHPASSRHGPTSKLLSRAGPSAAGSAEPLAAANTLIGDKLRSGSAAMVRFARTGIRATLRSDTHEVYLFSILWKGHFGLRGLSEVVVVAGAKKLAAGSGAAFAVGAVAGVVGNNLGKGLWFWAGFVVLVIAGTVLSGWLTYRGASGGGTAGVRHHGDNRIGKVSGGGSGPTIGMNYGEARGNSGSGDR